MPLPELYPMPQELKSDAAKEGSDKIVWQTSPTTFRWNRHPDHHMIKDVVLDIIKPGHAEYVGFGEQGGPNFLKQPTFMNYFSEICRDAGTLLP
jgi:hypothetical protein